MNALRIALCSLLLLIATAPLMAQGTYTQIDNPPNASNSLAYGVSNTGEVIGNVPSTQASVNFLFKHGKYYSMAIPNAPADILYGVNPAGTALVGTYSPSSGVVNGFVYQNKILQTLLFPGASATFAYGINSSGEVVGTFYPTTGGVHGFIWTPPSAAAPKP